MTVLHLLLIYYKNKLFKICINSDYKESTIVSRYVSSMKKNPSIQGAIYRAKNHPYQRPNYNLDPSTSHDTSVITNSSCNNKVTELV